MTMRQRIQILVMANKAYAAAEQGMIVADALADCTNKEDARKIAARVAEAVRDAARAAEDAAGDLDPEAACENHHILETYATAMEAVDIAFSAAEIIAMTIQ